MTKLAVSDKVRLFKGTEQVGTGTITRLFGGAVINVVTEDVGRQPEAPETKKSKRAKPVVDDEAAVQELTKVPHVSDISDQLKWCTYDHNEKVFEQDNDTVTLIRG